MLVLSRKVGEELVVGDNIRIVVNRISGNRVSIGVKAPGDVRIVRGELEPIIREFEVDDLSQGLALNDEFSDTPGPLLSANAG